MPLDPAMPPSLISLISDLKDRISKLERLSQLPNSSFQGGLLRFLDDDGNIHWAAGNNVIDTSFDDPVVDTNTTVAGGYGLVAADENGSIYQAELGGFRGRAFPPTPLSMHSTTAKLETNASFVNQYEVMMEWPLGDVVRVAGAVQTSAGTTGELRLSTAPVGAFAVVHTSVLSLPSGTDNNYDFQWLHPAAVGLGDPRTPTRRNALFLQLEARRVSGTGNVNIFPPRLCEITSSWLYPDAATTGNPVLIT